jgi:hypothetical protein
VEEVWRKKYRRGIWRQCGGRDTEERDEGSAEEDIERRDTEKMSDEGRKEGYEGREDEGGGRMCCRR